MANMLTGGKEFKQQASIANVTPAWYKYIIFSGIKQIKLQTPPPYYLYSEQDIQEAKKLNKIPQKTGKELKNARAGVMGTTVEILDEKVVKISSSFFARVKVLGLQGYMNLNQLRKPTKSSLAKAFYGNIYLLELLQNNPDLNTTAFNSITPSLTNKKLPEYIKENSDAVALKIINEALGDSLHKILKINTKEYKNIVGCIPVTIGEPKADVCLVGFDNDNLQLYPACFISFKKLNFYSYGGHTETGNEGVDFKEATKDKREKRFRKLKNNDVVKSVLYGSNFKMRSNGVNNCNHIIKADSLTLSGTELKALSPGKIYNNGEMPKDDMIPVLLLRPGESRDRILVSTLKYALQIKAQEI